MALHVHHPAGRVQIGSDHLRPRKSIRSSSHVARYATGPARASTAARSAGSIRSSRRVGRQTQQVAPPQATALSGEGKLLTARACVVTLCVEAALSPRSSVSGRLAQSGGNRLEAGPSLGSMRSVRWIPWLRIPNRTPRSDYWARVRHQRRRGGPPVADSRRQPGRVGACRRESARVCA